MDLFKFAQFGQEINCFQPTDETEVTSRSLQYGKYYNCPLIRVCFRKDFQTKKPSIQIPDLGIMKEYEVHEQILAQEMFLKIISSPFVNRITLKRLGFFKEEDIEEYFKAIS